ncbi:SDR family oxidoreductase [Glutamicibacter endophyticus]|uniref:SDR family oxidoreductase n=1 Tax=Glutamicibacter endophyticus TaxID=1522174 RepID=UPI003AF1ABB9
MSTAQTNAFDLTGQLALVTGSSRGIGRALAAGLAQAGATVVVHGRNLEAVNATARQIAEGSGSTVHASSFDVTDEAAVDAALGEIESSLGVPDILVNNAGMQLRAPLADFSLADWHTLVDTNLTSAFLMARRVARGMIDRGSGRIINIGSVQSSLARPNITPYAATKGGIAMLTRGLCAELAPHGITANTLAPGYFSTELTAALVADEEFSQWVAQRTPAGRWGQVEDLVGPLVFLASDAARFVNGQTLYVDGGMTSVV